MDCFIIRIYNNIHWRFIRNETKWILLYLEMCLLSFYNDLTVLDSEFRFISVAGVEVVLLLNVSAS